MSPPPRNSKGRRSTRAAAGRRSLPTGFVKTEEAIDEPGSEDSDAEVDSDGERPSKRVKLQYPIPPASPISPIRYFNFSTNRQPSPFDLDTETAQQPVANSIARAPQTVSLTFNVPKGHEGPFVVNLNLAELTAGYTSRPIAGCNDARLKLESPAILDPSSRNIIGPSFLDLPSEIRSMVYSYVLTSPDQPLSFAHSNFQLSGQFLRTCKLVWLEAAPVLYGRNRFILDREVRPAGPYYKRPWYEIGYRNIRLWLHDIGAANIGLLRKIKLTLDDGSPSLSPPKDTLLYTYNPRETSRYVYDAHLIECLKFLARHGRLRELELVYKGRKNLTYKDDRFVECLSKVQADYVNHEAQNKKYPGLYLQRIEHDMDRWLQTRMERKKKLYPHLKKEASE